MITAQEARNLVALTTDIAEQLDALNADVSAAAGAGLFFLEKSVGSEIMAIQVANILIGLGYDARYDSHRQLLKVRWSS